MNFFFIILLWQHILYLCTLFLVQEGKSKWHTISAFVGSVIISESAICLYFMEHNKN